MRKGVILSEAKNPGESSRANGLSGFFRDRRQSTGPLDISRRNETSTAATWIAIALLIATLSPPLLTRSGQPLIAMAFEAFFSKVCHQHAARSFIFFGMPTAVCVRCLGIYSGAVLGSLIRIDQKTAIRCFGLALVLNCLDVDTESLGLHGNMPLSRLLIGMSLGIAVGALFSAGDSEPVAHLHT